MMVMGIAGEPREAKDDDVLDPTLVEAAVIQQVLKCRSVGGLGGFAGVLELLAHFPTLPLAVVETGTPLRRQRQILGLFFRRDAAINNSCHWYAS
jgi:hypothetical protein